MKHRKGMKLNKVPPHRGTVILTSPQVTFNPPLAAMRPATRRSLLQMARLAAEKLQHR